jgi:formylglycine-generating enzyme required for sulfatase activity/predicted MPP superfamily phosphohydrolase
MSLGAVALTVDDRILIFKHKSMKINWLHLTDLHRGMSDQSWLWPTIEREFFNDLTEVVKSHGPIDLIFFTGDFVQKGSAKEFEQLNKTLRRLYDHLSHLDSAPLLLAVPGNHDLVRPSMERPEVILMNSWDEHLAVRNEFWNNRSSPYRRVVKNAFKNYLDWNAKLPFPQPKVISGILPGDFSFKFEKENVKLGIVGLNTTFLQFAKGDFRGRLALHPSQLSGVCGENFTDWFHECDISILMTHQSRAWLNAESGNHFDSEIAPAGRFALHLFGHEHESYQSISSVGGGYKRRSMQGHALFGLETWGEGVKRNHGYSFGQFSFQQGVASAGLRVWPRRAEIHQDGHRHLVRDQSFTLAEDGGTETDQIPMERFYCFTSPAASESHHDVITDGLFRVLVMATENDLAETISSVVQYLNTALGVEAFASFDVSGLSDRDYNFAILLQGCWWEDGSLARYWESIPVDLRAGFVIDPSADWPPRKLVEREKQDVIEEFIGNNSDLKFFQDPLSLPELVGEVISEAIAKLDQKAGSSAIGLKNWERSYLSFRIPSWISGRTAGRPHILEPDSGTELYRPELYVSLKGSSTRWVWKMGETPSLHPISPEKRNLLEGELEVSAPLARWISSPELARVALVGAPGGGKTVFLTRIAAAFAHACLGRARELEESLNLSNLRSTAGTVPIPIVLEATRIEKQEGQGRNVLLSSICEEFAQAGNTPSWDDIDSGLKEGRYLLLIDALDEVSDASRRLFVLDLLKGVAGDDCYPKLRMILTTRSARYTGSLAFGSEFELVDVSSMEWPQVEAFCRNWSHVRKRDNIYLTDLMLAVTGLAVQVEKEGRDEAMTSNPLMLTAICMVYERYQSLPDDRARLCSLLVDDLCRSRNSEDVEHSWRLSDANKRDLLERIALAMQQGGEQVWSVSRAVEIAMRGVPAAEILRQQRATKHLHWAAEHTGLLRFQQPEKGEEEIRFWHRLFREFLAASRLSQEDVTVKELIDGLWRKGYLSDPFWEDVIRLLARTLGTLEKAKSLRNQLTNLAASNPLHRGRLLGLLAAGVIESRDLFPDVKVNEMAEEFSRIYETEGATWPMRDRLLFLQGLGGLDPTSGDPRLKQERWVPIPGGMVKVGKVEETKPMRGRSNQPKLVERLVTVDDFLVGFAPVTVQEFKRFLEEGCDREDFWVDAPKKFRMPKQFAETLEWRKQLRHLNRPVVDVSYWDALAYCKWKSSLRDDNLIVRLPTFEEQLRILEVLELPLDDSAKTASHDVGNLPDSLIGHCSPVGVFAQGKSLEIADFVGNVLEWTLNPGAKEQTLRGERPVILSVAVWQGCFNERFYFRRDRREHTAHAAANTSADFLGFRCVLSSVVEPAKEATSQKQRNTRRDRKSKRRKR